MAISTHLTEGTQRKQLLGTIDHVQLPVACTHTAVEWYTGYLGFEAANVFRDDLAVVRLPSGPTLFLWRTRDATTANFTKDGEIMPALGIACNDIAKLRDVLEEIGAKITLHETDPVCGTFLKFLDPFGNMIVAHQDHRK